MSVCTQVWALFIFMAVAPFGRDIIWVSAFHFISLAMCPSAIDTDDSVRAGVIIAFQTLDSQTSSFHRLLLVYFLKADFSILAEVYECCKWVQK